MPSGVGGFVILRFRVTVLVRTTGMAKITPDKKKLRKVARLLKEFCDKHGVTINATAYGTHSGIAVPHEDGEVYEGCFLDFHYNPKEGVVTLDGETL